MISVFISIGPLHKQQTTIKAQKLLSNILVHFSNHYLWPLAHWGYGPRAPSKYALGV